MASRKRGYWSVYGLGDKMTYPLQHIGRADISSDGWLLAAFVVFVLWVLFAHPPRGLSPVEYKSWYRNRYLNSLYWRTFSRLRRIGRPCAHWWRGGCSGPRHVHHRPWAYRWLFWEWLIWPFGTVVLCDKHHSKMHK